MSRYQLIISNADGQIVGQFDTSSESRRDDIVASLPSDLTVERERVIPEEANLGNSIRQMSDNIVEWDDRLFEL